MMQITKVNDFIQKNPLAALGIMIALVAIIGLIGWGMYALITKPETPPKVVTVTFGDGQNSVTVERNGKVTIKTPFGTFTQTWDPAKVKQFFESLENLDFDQLTQFIGTGMAVELTLADGEKVMVVIDAALEETVNLIQETLEDIYEEEGVTFIPSPLPTLEPFPVPTTGTTPTPSPTPSSYNPWKTGNDVEDPEVFGCEQIDPKTGRKIIISNTVCAQ